MKSIVVFCGSGMGNNAIYQQVAAETGALLAQKGIQLVYGGAQIGLMGAVADAVLAAGGQVTGVIPHFLNQKEIGHTGVTELITVNNMHERKLKMFELSEGIIALPGGWGTMEELFEMLTWAQLGLHAKPIGLLNVNGYYNSLLQLCDHMATEGFLKPVYRGMLLAEDNIKALLQTMEQYVAPDVQQWITENKT